MSTIQERLQLKRVPVDTWNIREQLCLASAVVRSGDQNWMSVSRALKTVGEPNRPPDWYSQKSCAAQYGALLEHVETPKRKKRSSEGAVETPQESILKRLTQERIVEIQKTLAEMNQQYDQLKTEITEVRNSSTSEERLKDLWSNIEAAKRAKERDSARRAAWLKEREDRRARADRTWRPAPNTPTLPATPAPPSSPLLTSLLKSSPVVTTPQHITHPANVVETVSPSATAPTLSMLLEKSAPSGTAQHESRHAAIEHIKSQLVQIEQQLIASTSSSPVPSVPLPPAPAPAVDIDDIEIKAEDVYAFRDIDIHIPPVTAMHKPTNRVLEKPSFKKEDSELPAIVEETPAPQEETIKEEQISVDDIPEEIIPTTATETVPEPTVVEVEVPQIEQPEPEVKISFPEVKFPTPEIKVIQPDEQKVKEEVKEQEVVVPEQEVVVEEPPVEEVQQETVVEEKCIEQTTEEVVEETTEVVEEEEAAAEVEVEETPLVPPESIPLPPEIPETEVVNEEPVVEVPTTQEVVEPSPQEKESVAIEEEKKPAEETSTETSATEDIKKEEDAEDSIPLKDMVKESAPSQDVPKTREEDSHTETDDDTPMELSREEEKDGKKRRDYSRKKKSNSRTWSGSESAAEASAPESPSGTDAEREHRLWKKSVMLVYSRLCAHKYASLFLRPISDEEAPGYSTVIKRPMDLSAIRRNIENGVIRTTAEFQRDVLLMLSNALMYNSSEHSVYTMAKEMHEEAQCQLGMLLAAQAHAGLTAPPPRRKRRRPDSPLAHAPKRH